MSLSRKYFLATDRLGFSNWEGGDEALALTLWGTTEVSALIGGPFTTAEVHARLRREIDTSSIWQPKVCSQGITRTTCNRQGFFGSLDFLSRMKNFTRPRGKITLPICWSIPDI